MTAIVEKIQKLLSLANSDNEHEAKIATQKASELLIKYNLSLQEVGNHSAEYCENDVLTSGHTVKGYQKMIASILTEFFFVFVIVHNKPNGMTSGKRNGVGKKKYLRTIRMMGTKENAQIASYIFTYLNTIYPDLWKKYKAENNLKENQRNSYWTGLTVGIAEILKKTRWKVQEETGLVLYKDPGLEEYSAQRVRGSYAQRQETDIDKDIYQDGVKHGLDVKLRKPLGSKSENNNIQIEAKK